VPHPASSAAELLPWVQSQVQGDDRLQPEQVALQAAVFSLSCLTPAGAQLPGVCGEGEGWVQRRTVGISKEHELMLGYSVSQRVGAALAEAAAI